mmetsp:Transcript_106810/g.300251  ORF Transcript_106810/g.300251 Transcript_106810/m.300251 type:complete len:117 (+) Transcript_106810:983-1333(+)
MGRSALAVTASTMGQGDIGKRADDRPEHVVVRPLTSKNCEPSDKFLMNSPSRGVHRDAAIRGNPENAEHRSGAVEVVYVHAQGLRYSMEIGDHHVLGRWLLRCRGSQSGGGRRDES